MLVNLRGYRSQIPVIRVVQGDSTDLYTLDTGLGDTVADVSSTDWAGVWGVRETESRGESIAQGVLTKNTDQTAFQLHLSPSDTENLPLGGLWLSCEVFNPTLFPAYRREVVNCQLIVLAGGLNAI